MTLIDAEALYKHFAELEEEARNKYISTTNEIEKSWWSIVLTERTAYKHDVADAPVIKTKTGHWYLTIDIEQQMYTCSECHGRMIKCDYDNAVGTYGLSYCPYCGARMLEVTK